MAIAHLMTIMHFCSIVIMRRRGARHARPERGLLTRPTLSEILAYRAHIDEAMMAAMDGFADQLSDLITLGLHHEQQHQELLLTDILHLFSRNPIGPALLESEISNVVQETPLEWIIGSSGIQEIGCENGGFSFDCEGPRHPQMLHPHAIANRPVNNREWQEFIDAGGYQNSQYWLSDGWAWVKDQAIVAPLYWRDTDGTHEQFTWQGWQPRDPNLPVRHISLYEADAFATWAGGTDGLETCLGARLPTEAEWGSCS